MTDGNQNPNDLPEEDWAMSEPEILLVKPKPVAPVDEAAAKLYAPPDTGELDDWELDDSEPAAAVSTPGKPAAEPPIPGAFIPPSQSFEVLKPIAFSPGSGGDWSVSPPSDGWKMPEPVFRRSDGEILTRLGKRSESRTAGEEPVTTEGHLAEIYEPPVTEESAEITDEFASLADPQPAAPHVTSSVSNPAVVPTEKRSSRLSWIVWALAATGLLLLVLIVGTFFVFYYGMWGLRH